MPEKLDRCVNGLLGKWKDDPDSAPNEYKSGDKMKPIKTEEDRKSAAIAICRASTGLSEEFGVALSELEDSLVSVVLEDGKPVLKGVAAVNRPYIKFMRPLETVMREGEEWIRAQIVKFGIYAHPLGPDGKLPFTRKFWDRVIENFKNNVYGQKVFFDKAHRPNEGSLGEIEELVVAGDGVDALIRPTRNGLDAVKSRDVNYASIDLSFNHQGNLVEVAASEELQEVDLMDEIFLQFATQEVVMAGENEREKETPEQAPDRDETKLSEMEAKLEERLQAIDDKQAAFDKQVELFEKEREAFLKEREAASEGLRKKQVELFLEELSQPKNGRLLDQAVLDTARAALLGEPVGEDEAAVKLSEDPDAVELHAYYRGAIEELLKKVPRVVPAGANVEASDQRKPNTARSHVSEKRELALSDMALAWFSVQDTWDGNFPENWKDVVPEAKLAEFNETLDRRFGPQEV